MQNVTSLQPLYKRDSKGQVRVWTVEIGHDNDNVAGIRSISGMKEGEKITSVWNISEAKNVGRANATNAKEQADAEAKAQWTKKSDKEYFVNIVDIDSYERFKPMLANDYTKLKNPVDFPVTSQPKLDGIRCIARADGLWSRSGKPHMAIPHIWEALAPIFEQFPNLVLDGELYNHELKDDFNTIVSLVRKSKPSEQDLIESAKLVQYHVYDTFIDEPFVIRKTSYINTVRGLDNECIQAVPNSHIQSQVELDEVYSWYIQDGYEGQMVRLNGPYENKRSKNLLKRKEFITNEFQVVDVVEGQGAWSGYAKRFILALPDGREFGSGVRGNQEQLKTLLESTNPTWATCRYFELTPDGVPRFPVVIDYGTGVRTD